ncbi:helix-turn-helix domain-containing protein [Streptomyces avicenniae]|uniref:helix-turn-helix domain-containing protein n=1 Tax=Streptomyces avicenniae TaxID=500153 RepID=UPI000699378C|nr:helix-turn-helix transcriptional regulator [Streptomyces avicenniae]
MPGPTRPTLRRIELGYELRRLRERIGMSREDAVKGLRPRLSDTKLLRIETGLHDLRSAELLRQLLDRYEVTDPDTVDELLRVQREARSQDWWAGYRSVMRPGMPRFVGIESAAVAAMAWHPMLIPGLLQTETYARALHQLARPVDEVTSEFGERNVELRMRRKAVRLLGDQPLALSVIVWEPALRYCPGDPEILVEQYAEIARLAALDHVTFQVLPQTTRGYITPYDLTVMDLGPVLPRVVQVDAGGTPSVTDRPRDVAHYTRMYESMTRSALPPEDTPRVLHDLTREIQR